MPGPLGYLWYEAAYWLTLVTFTFGWSIRARGGNDVPRKGPVLLIANHQSYIDPLMIGLAVRRHLDFLARKGLLSSGVRALFAA